MSAAALMLFAWVVEASFGWPDWLYRRIRHPVVWVGAVITALDNTLNRPEWAHAMRYVSGALTTLMIVTAATGVAWGLSYLLGHSLAGFALQALIASSLIASRSLSDHIAAVAHPLAGGDMKNARTAVSMIVGRDPDQLDGAGIARASLESLAENASDGVIAPLFWGALFGLPGLAAYKAINTLDSMLGHRDTRYAAFGGFAARLDDAANLIPARLTGLFVAAASLKPTAFTVMARDARRHRSPNAGWPEAAMAGGLGIRLSGPRSYGGETSEEPWLNAGAPDPTGQDMFAGLALYRRAMALSALLLIVLAWCLRP
ncbi:MAG: adenosylcobinamide-phosphate synthase CbiB [Pseudomonadota bacterium]